MTTKSKLRRHDKPYTAHDLERMRKLAAARVSARVAAERLGRTPGGVKYKAMVEGIRFHAIEQPRGAQIKARRTLRRRARAGASRRSA